MLARVRSGALVGIDAVVVECEVDMALGLPYFNVVGLADGATRESKVRVTSALKNSGFDLPQKRITVNLAPADLRKEGATFELPVALGVLAAARLLSETVLTDLLFGGELSLDGWVKPIRGVLPLALAARNCGMRGVMVPAENAREAALVDGLEIYPVRHLTEAVRHLTGEEPLTPFDRGAPVPCETPASPSAPDMEDVLGQEDLKDALEIAAAGGHNVLMCGPPGSGKTMLARRVPSILPTLTREEALDVTKVASVLGLLRGQFGLVQERPFRSPHHTISDAGLVGGGPSLRPGELSMAHHGVLFLDELPEFRQNVLEVLRQPLEEGVIHLARANHHVAYPCQVMLVAAMNPCPCGFFNVPPYSRCHCHPGKVQDYFTRVSGPLLDRIDMTLQTDPVDPQRLRRLEPSGKDSAYYRERVEEARLRQRHRLQDEPGVHCNAQMSPRQVREHCRLSTKAERHLERAMELHGLSARAHDRILRLARTRADLEGHDGIHDEDLLLAINQRMLDRESWLNGTRRGQQHPVRELRGLMDPPPW
ncbi:MAG TPA: YifB family Mg chelatase-like AAA ATPase [Myxococcaceae bacterium]|nr:YifB family Mg chelatase-like AAA ATPase [Myxococcaceae bacterium]